MLNKPPHICSRHQIADRAGSLTTVPLLSIKGLQSLSLSPSLSLSVNKATDYQNYYQGMWDCTGEQTDELTFRRGEAIYILSKVHTHTHTHTHTHSHTHTHTHTCTL